MNEKNIGKFLEGYHRGNTLDIESDMKRSMLRWESIENKFLSRVESMFNVTYPSSTVIAYLSSNSRCTYNIEDNYFFLYHRSKNSNATIMHELLHFYTHQRFFGYMQERGVTSEKYNDIKEALTVLLNVEFSDLMDNAIDAGYAQHVELRTNIVKLWTEGRDLVNVIEKLST